MGIVSGEASGAAVDPSVWPAWMRTGYKFFPYAAQQSDRWWVLRLNFDFPEHEMYTLFVDGHATLDVTGSTDHHVPLAASVGALKPFDRQAGEPVLMPELAEAAVRAVAQYVVYGSEVDDLCDWCDHLADHDPMTRYGGTDAASRPADS